MVFWFWLFMGRGYPLRKKGQRRPSPPRSTAIGTAYEPFLYKFLFTTAGRLVMYTVMLYLFPASRLHSGRWFISLMIALTGIPGTILGIVLAKNSKADHAVPFL